MPLKYITFIFAFLWPGPAYTLAFDTKPDVTSYTLTIEPRIDQGDLSGAVIIDFELDKNAESVIFAAGNLVIDTVVGAHVLGFRKTGADLILDLAKRTGTANKVTITYHGTPRKGLLFDADNGLAYTVYHTSQWMVCNDSPDDKALFNLDLVVAMDQRCVASGVLFDKAREHTKVCYSFRQTYESPTYTYGFAIGDFNKAEEDFKGVQLAYLGHDYSSDQLKVIFRETPAILSFFEEKSGIDYYQSVYTQLLVGDYYQEMSGYSILKAEYGNLVLKDPTETNLISHELAHQWWGNRISCKNWNHFWLNEAMATFMSAAYNEHRFGRDKYHSDIESYHKVYKAIKKRGNDKPLVFPNWSNPSRDDRNLVYFKGAYVLHLLRQEMGNQAFWKAIRFYSTKYFGKSVKTIDFQRALETSSGRSLDAFFDKWIY